MKNICEADCNDNIILIGMPASGKSTIGVVLAKVLGMDFVDTDLLIQEQAGKTLEEIIGEKGRNEFLDLEEMVCKSVRQTNTVIATGGSVVYSQAAMAQFKRIGTVVYLKIDLDTLTFRLSNMKARGVILRDGQSMKELYEERVPLYEKYAEITISIRFKSFNWIISFFRK